MIRIGNNFLVEDASELPDCSHKDVLYLDVETNSFDPTTGGLNPWKGHRIAGVAVTYDDCPYAWYVPVRHEDKRWNIDESSFKRWLHDTVSTCKLWVNHNVKFDAHFCAADGAVFQGRLFCTLVMAKLINSDRGVGGGYGLDALSADWLGVNIDAHDQAVQAYLGGIRLPRNKKAKNYALVPADIMGPYACQDVLTTRALYKYELKKHAEYLVETPTFDLIWNIEQRLTPVLYDMEVHGLSVNAQELMVSEYVIRNKLILLHETMESLAGRTIDPTSNSSCFDILCNAHGLPVLGWTEEGEPSFDKEALTSYLLHPKVERESNLNVLVTKILEYRKLNTLLTFFVEPFQQHAVDGIMHPEYNQLVRTGRMSCKRPNAQQNSKASKALIHPRAGKAYLCCDASQIEFRLMAMYAGDEAVLQAYAQDPDTDFHSWVAKMCGIPRKPAKNVNFCIGYGGGKKKVLAQLSANMDLMGVLKDAVDKMIVEGKIASSQRDQVFDEMCRMRAENVYDDYHATLPGIRKITDRAAKLILKTGYVVNKYGRRRYLPAKAAWRGFNSLTQGLASDIIKGGMVALAPRYNEKMRRAGIDMCINVHDEITFEGDAALMRAPETVSYCVSHLERPLVPLGVPIRFSHAVSNTCWADADSDKVEARVEFQRLSQLDEMSIGPGSL